MSEKFLVYHQIDEDFLRSWHDLLNAAFKNNYASGNLIHNFLTHFILNDENFFSLNCERKHLAKNSMANVAKHDFELFMKFFEIDFNKVPEYIINFKNESEKFNDNLILNMSNKLLNAKNPDEFFNIVANFYETHGTGILAFNKAFRFDSEKNNLVPVENVGDASLNDIIGCDIQKGELIANTEAFISGKPANNVLLYGDGGTGKSTSVKALLNAYSDKGLRIIEIYKYQFRDISKIINLIRRRNYYFILFIDDLSFEENESEYKFLKAIIEGGIETRPSNVLIYATSNRRHIVKEIWSDRDDMEHSGEIHRSDTVEEKLSLASRFGIALNYSSPNRKTYHEIVLTLAKNSGLENIDEEELLAGADKWEIRHGGKSGRAARQYIDYLSGRD